MKLRLLLPFAALLCVACSNEQVIPRSATLTQASGEQAMVVDSIFPMDVMIARFQAAASPRVPAAALGGGAASRNELIDRFARALRDSSATALRQLTLDVSEFAYLYFPVSRFAADPYRQPPELAWMLVQQNGRKGESRLLRHFGGTAFDVASHSCELEPVIEGDNRLWEGCTVRMGGRAGALRLFGSIIERHGRYKFVSLANDL